MNLGDLEFKAEDFADKNNPNRKLLSEDDIALADAMAEFSAEQANRLLRERLAKAQEISADGKRWGCIKSVATQRARLVCIEEVEK